MYIYIYIYMCRRRAPGSGPPGSRRCAAGARAPPHDARWPGSSPCAGHKNEHETRCRCSASLGAGLARQESPLDCGKAVTRLLGGFLLLNTFFHKCCQNFTRISPEFQQNSPEFHRKFARTSNWSTLKKGKATTRPSHTLDRRVSVGPRTGQCPGRRWAAEAARPAASA